MPDTSLGLSSDATDFSSEIDGLTTAAASRGGGGGGGGSIPLPVVVDAVASTR